MRLNSVCLHNYLYFFSKTLLWVLLYIFRVLSYFSFFFFMVKITVLLSYTVFCFFTGGSHSWRIGDACRCCDDMITFICVGLWRIPRPRLSSVAMDAWSASPPRNGQEKKWSTRKSDQIQHLSMCIWSIVYFFFSWWNIC